MFENIEKALTIMLLAIGVKLDGEDEQVKKRKKRSVWMKPWLKNRLRTSAYQNIFQELRLKDKEEFRRYLRINTETYQVKLFIYLFIHLFWHNFTDWKTIANVFDNIFCSSQYPYYVDGIIRFHLSRKILYWPWKY